MTDKPLSETHPTLWAAYHKGAYNLPVRLSCEMVQRCTIDIAEYERLKKELDEVYRPAQSVRLKGFDIGFKEGERRSFEEIERLKKEADSWMEDARRNLQNAEYWKSEYERLKEELEVAKVKAAWGVAMHWQCTEDYERLKKEFDDYKKVAGAVQYIDEFHRGVAEGERRAMERVKKAIFTVANGKLGCEIHESFDLSLLWEELNLEEVRE